MRRIELKRGTSELKRTGFPSRGKPLKSKAPMARGKKRINQIGPKGQEWIDVRAELKIEFESRGITTCQACGADNYLGFAHCRKRRNLLEGEIYHCALLCNPCHDEIECGEPEAMHDTVHALRRRDGLE